MCGIAGFVGAGGHGDIAAMARALIHRGPDAEGFHEAPEHRLFLAHRRLSIIDIDGGAQPMANEDGAVRVVFNGEIYNHLELRHELESRGHRFASGHSDTEVIVHGWEEWGTEMPARLNGMFAFAVWDARQRCLFLARDRMGEKPLFWGRGKDVLLFASELSALAAHGGFAAEVDRATLKKYFAHGFYPGATAFYRNSWQLPPGHWLRYDAAPDAVTIRCYWRFRIEADPVKSEAAAAEELRHLLFQAVERRLMSDVPLGVFLSGGIDSAMVAAFAAKARGGAPIDSFTIGFAEKSFDESEPARAMASAAGSRHHEKILSMDDARDLIPDVLGRLDAPLGDPSILPTYLLSRFARESVTVALSGDGGDELFAGYDTFAALRPAQLYARLMPAGLHKGMRALADLLPKSKRNMSLDFKLRRALAGLSYRRALWNPIWLAPLEPADIAALFREPTDPEDLYAEVIACWESSPRTSLIDRTLEFYTRFYLADGILTKVDRASMMNGLEVRAVFLDNDVVEFARRLPADYKLRAGTRKYLLKRALAGVVPRRVLDRPKKGFGIPLTAWLGALPIAAKNCAGLDEAFVERHVAAHRSGHADHRLFLWNWIVLNQILRGDAGEARPRAGAA